MLTAIVLPMSPMASLTRRPISRWRAASCRCSARSARCSSEFRPDEAAVEESFVNRNAASTLKLGVARGVVLLAPAERGLPVAEYSANLIKKAVVGAGHAEKAQVQMMVRRILPGFANGAADAADALAVAICHAHHAATRRAWDNFGTGRTPMIAKLAGIVDQVTPEGAVIDVGGVGYLAFCSTRTLGRLPPAGAPVRLLIETHVREDHIHLYGFIDAAERDWFRLLTTVQGVGARLALAVLSAVGPDELGLAIVSQDKASLARADGVGPRLAARIVNELRDKAGSLALTPLAGRIRTIGDIVRADRRRPRRRCGFRTGQSRISPRRSVWRGAPRQRSGLAPARRLTR